MYKLDSGTNNYYQKFHFKLQKFRVNHHLQKEFKNRFKKISSKVNNGNLKDGNINMNNLNGNLNGNDLMINKKVNVKRSRFKLVKQPIVNGPNENNNSNGNSVSRTRFYKTKYHSINNKIKNQLVKRANRWSNKFKSPKNLISKSNMRSKYKLIKPKNNLDLSLNLKSKFKKRKVILKVPKKSVNRKYVWIKPKVNLNSLKLSSVSSAKLSAAKSSDNRARRLLNRARILMAKKDNKSNQLNTKYCLYYCRYGRCNKQSSCSYVHDPDKVAICTRLG